MSKKRKKKKISRRQITRIIWTIVSVMVVVSMLAGVLISRL